MEEGREGEKEGEDAHHPKREVLGILFWAKKSFFLHTFLFSSEIFTISVYYFLLKMSVNCN